MATNKNRILNHIGMIKEKAALLDASVVKEERLCRAGHIELQLTDKCTLNCSNCHFRDLGDHTFSFDWLDRIVKNIRPSAITLAGGGEPTIYSRFNDAVLKLAEIPRVKLGLITNGTVIPKGEWVKHISWIRVSVYSVENGMYSGRIPQFLDVVINNIQWYLRESNIPNVGIHFLFYRKNMSDILSFSKRMYFRFKDDKKNFGRVHIQFKPAFIMARPTQLTPELHKENVELLPDYDQIRSTLSEFENEFSKDESFKVFLETQSNFSIFNQLSNGYLDELINITRVRDFPLKKNEKNRCYVCLAYQLIDPNGFIYPCLTLAEHRLKEFSLGHISELPNSPVEKLNKFYTASTECCNKIFCRNWSQNEVVKENIDKPLKIDIPKDNFF
ncbi:MAG: radical SAM protein [Hyphomicrobium sp.]|uniref:radical SAM protein n=1 Tax=Hyphomicrobium sp. TaxID=82 RepID=UPI003566BC3D